MAVKLNSVTHYFDGVTALAYRGRVFQGGPIETVDVIVRDGRVLVWDDTAGHLTACYSISDKGLSDIKHAVKG